MVAPLRSPARRGQDYDLERLLGSVGDALFKISLDPAHLVGYVRKAKHRAIASFRKCVSAWNKDPVFGVIGIQSGPRH
jgi:hypothetical protein